MHKGRKPIQFYITDDGCHEVISHGGSSFGYPHFYINKKVVNGHKYIYELINGPIPKGTVIRHLCNNPKCINPRHLKAGTQKENVGDIIMAGNQAFDGENHYKAKLTESQVIEIRRSTKKQPQLADEYKVSVPTINRIKNFKIWKRVPLMKIEAA